MVLSIINLQFTIYTFFPITTKILVFTIFLKFLSKFYLQRIQSTLQPELKSVPGIPEDHISQEKNSSEKVNEQIQSDNETKRDDPRGLQLLPDV